MKIVCRELEEIQQFNLRPQTIKTAVKIRYSANIVAEV